MISASLPVELRGDSQYVPNPSGRGGRSVKAYQAHLGPFGGYARSAADTKRNLVENITRFANEYRELEFFHFGKEIAIVWCEPHDMEGIRWCYRIITADGSRSSYSIVRDRSAAVSSARYMLATDHALADFYDRDAIEAAAEWLGDNSGSEYGHDAYEVRRYCAWQRAYAWGEAIGERDPHRYASEYYKDFLDRWDRPVRQTAQ